MRATFRSTFGTVVAMAGVAIGLGNIWRFPYMMGRDGGVIFLLVYLAISFAFGVPMLMAEWALGRHTRRGPWGAFDRAPLSKVWSVMLLVTIVMSASYYGVVVAWVLQEAVAFATWGVTGTPVPEFAELSSSAAVQLGYLLVTCAITTAVLVLGVRKGIERASKLVLPAFFVLFAAILVYVLRLPGAGAGLADFLRPELGHFTGRTALSALGQAIFSLGLGGTLMVMYGSFLRPEEDLPRAAVLTVTADVSAGLLAGLIVVPACLALGTDLASGPSLMFVVLPEVFEGMPAAPWVGTAFFGSVFLVAVLSLMAAYEICARTLVEGFGWRRDEALALTFGTQIALSLPAYVYAGYVAKSDLVWGTTMQPFGAAVAALAFAWSLGRARALEELRRGTELPVPSWILAWLRWVVPVAIVVTIVVGWIDWLS